MRFLSAAIAASLLLPIARAQQAAPPKDAWWKHAVIYEVYPRSFQDSNGDGIGDLNGITERLDYLQDLGIDAIWLTPMFPSPQVDFGYDVADYEAVDPQYGTMADMDRLIAEAKKRNIRVILDFVMNHTSDQHPWFKESASSLQNSKRDWYVWNTGQKRADGKPLPPNNWVSMFGGSAWQYSQPTKQFYYHMFTKEQPDLNWRNPAVENAMFNSMRFWLDRGIAGFRLDAVPQLFEKADLKDEPLTGELTRFGDKATDQSATRFLPEIHDTLRRMRLVVDRYHDDDRILIGETHLPDVVELDRWYGGAKKDELQLPMDMLVGFSGGLDAARFRKYLKEADTQIHGSQPLYVFDNHDRPRSWDRFKDGVHDGAIARLIASVLLTSRATAMMYYGEELGMVTDTPTRREDVRDPNGRDGWPKDKGRDGERKPMQWDTTAQAGFSTNAKTWLPVTPNYTTINVQTERADPGSLWNWYKSLIALRRSNAALRDGTVTMLDEQNPNILTYLRTAPDGSRVLVAMNMSPEAHPLATGLDSGPVRTLMTSAPELRDATTLAVTLPPYASWIVSLPAPQPPLSADQVEKLQRKLADWPQLGRYREEDQKLPPPAAGEQRVVFFGDSITDNWGRRYGKFFPGKPYINRGISGQTTPQMLIRFQQDVLQLHPACVVILAGINDIAANTGEVPLSAIEDNFRSMVTLAKAAHVRVVLSSVLPTSHFPWRPSIHPVPRVQQLNAWLQRFAADEHLIFLNYYPALVNSSDGMIESLAADKVLHPNDTGYAIMEPLAEKAIAEALAAPAP